MKKIYQILFLSVFSLPLSANYSELDWCSSKNLLATEKIICTDLTLRAADTLLSRIYNELMHYKGKEGHEGHWAESVKDEQKLWIKKRNKLNKKSKLLASYIIRIQQLHQWLADHTKRNR